MAQVKSTSSVEPIHSRSKDPPPISDSHNLEVAEPTKAAEAVTPDEAKQGPTSNVGDELKHDAKSYQSLVDQLSLVKSEKNALEQELDALKAELESTRNELEREVQRRCDLEQKFSNEVKKSTASISQPISAVTSMPLPPTVQSPATGASTTTAPNANSSKLYGQHAISQLPMTTRKKLSHLRAQIKRQASKAARSRLEKRSSVVGVATSSCDTASSHPTTSDHKGPFGTSLEATVCSPSRHITGDHPPVNSSSQDSPNTYLSTNSTTYPSGSAGSNSGASVGGVAATNNLTSDAMNFSSIHGQQSGENNTAIAAATTGLKYTSIGPHQMNQGHNNTSIGVSVHQKNFKQKLIALIKKFRTDGSDFGSEEQYREALERELMKAAAGRGSKAIEELLEEDIDVEAGSGSELEDWDNISETSTPKPSLRPFFSSTTLDKI